MIKRITIDDDLSPHGLELIEIYLSSIKVTVKLKVDPATGNTTNISTIFLFKRQVSICGSVLSKYFKSQVCAQQ